MKLNKELHKKYKSSGEILFNLENYNEINTDHKINFIFNPRNERNSFIFQDFDPKYRKRFKENFEEFIYIQYGEGEYDSYIINEYFFYYSQILETKTIYKYDYIKILYNIYLEIHKKNYDDIDPYENPIIYNKISFGVYISNLQDDFE